MRSTKWLSATAVAAVVICLSLIDTNRGSAFPGDGDTGEKSVTGKVAGIGRNLGQKPDFILIKLVGDNARYYLPVGADNTSTSDNRLSPAGLLLYAAERNLNVTLHWSQVGDDREADEILVDFPPPPQPGATPASPTLLPRRSR